VSRGGGGASQGRGGQRTRGGGGATSGALQVVTTRWRRRGQGKVVRQSQRRRDNRSNATTSRQTRGKWEGRHTRGKQEGRRQRTRGGGALTGQEAVAALREASPQPAKGAIRASSSSSSSSSYSPPCRDGGAPRKIPSDGGGSIVSRVVREFGISKIHAPQLSLSTPSHRCRRCFHRTHGAPFWWQQCPLRSSCGCSDRCGGWCDEKLTSVIRNYKSPVVLCVVGVWNSLLAKERWKDLFDSNSTICKYIFT